MDDTEIDYNYSLILTKSGEQIPIKAIPGISISVRIPGDAIEQEISLDVSEKDFTNIQTLAKTNAIGGDILRSKEADTPQGN